MAIRHLGVVGRAVTMITRRRPSDRSTAAHQAPLLTTPGTLACSQAGCAAVTGLDCAYVDRRGRRCDTAWCPEHRAVAGGAVYCRRHAGVVAAIETVDESLASAPDLDNRAASLVLWVGRDLEDRVRMLVAPRAQQIGLELADDPIRFVHRGLGRPRSWVRGVEADRPDRRAVHDRDRRRGGPPRRGRRPLRRP